MNDRYARYGAATGVLFVVLVIVGFLVTPKPPDADATASEIFNYIRDKQSTLHTVQLIYGAAGLMFIWFIGTLRNLLSNAEGDGGRLANTAFGGGLIAAATLMVGFALLAVAELHPAENGAALTHALVDASMLVPAVGAPAAAVFFAGNGLSILRSGYLPAWMGWLGLVAAVFNLLGIGAVTTDHGAFSGTGVIGLFCGFVLFLVWNLLASILLFRKLGEGQAPQGGQAPA